MHKCVLFFTVFPCLCPPPLLIFLRPYINRTHTHTQSFFSLSIDVLQKYNYVILNIFCPLAFLPQQYLLEIYQVNFYRMILLFLMAAE